VSQVPAQMLGKRLRCINCDTEYKAEQFGPSEYEVSCDCPSCKMCCYDILPCQGGLVTSAPSEVLIVGDLRKIDLSKLLDAGI